MEKDGIDRWVPKAQIARHPSPHRPVSSLSHHTRGTLSLAVAHARLRLCRRASSRGASHARQAGAEAKASHPHPTTHNTARHGSRPEVHPPLQTSPESVHRRATRSGGRAGSLCGRWHAHFGLRSRDDWRGATVVQMCCSSLPVTGFTPVNRITGLWVLPAVSSSTVT